MNDHKKKYAKDSPLTKDLHELVKRVKPTMLIGASAQTNAFNAQILQDMLEISPRPVIFALSNPTIKAECTAEDAFIHTKVNHSNNDNNCETNISFIIIIIGIILLL